MRPLVFVPTLNERENVEELHRQIRELALETDILFVDDASPDGTGAVLDRLAAGDPRVTVIHRPGKQGIGSAHLCGIRYAYERGYEWLVTMDCDFTHSPADIPRLLAAAAGSGLAVGSRYMQPGSLPGWSPFRRCLTLLGHFLTKTLLGLPADASGAFRAYHLTAIPLAIFEMAVSRSYAFFFESLFILARNGYRVVEIPIVLPARTYGHSKLTFREAFRSFRYLVGLALENAVLPGRFRLARHTFTVQPQLALGLASSEWDGYWKRKPSSAGTLYEVAAAIYRQAVIRPNLERALRRTFPRGARLLHAGCGSGQVDERLHGEFQIAAADISPEALGLYSRNNPDAYRLDHADIFALPYADREFDGVYNLGVVEHFPRREIIAMLREFLRILKPGGRVVIFWPHRMAPSVMFLGAAHFCLRWVFKSRTQLHPPEVSLLTGKRYAREILEEAGFECAGYQYGFRDGFIQSVVVGAKPHPAPQSK
jgi:dolichol-phosphate mannosyltransferase